MRCPWTPATNFLLPNTQIFKSNEPLGLHPIYTNLFKNSVLPFVLINRSLPFSTQIYMIEPVNNIVNLVKVEIMHLYMQQICLATQTWACKRSVKIKVQHQHPSRRSHDPPEHRESRTRCSATSLRRCSLLFGHAGWTSGIARPWPTNTIGSALVPIDQPTISHASCVST